MKLRKGLRAATLTIASFGLVTTGLAVAGPTYADGSGSTVVPETDPAVPAPATSINPPSPLRLPFLSTLPIYHSSWRSSRIQAGGP
ncbi:MAG: hypothetical protein OSA11_06115 [Candidatus Nanopelagicales bacterium]|nr:hypothetical protein [Candidatus Nanopelagicales bacterium]